RLYCRIRANSRNLAIGHAQIAHFDQRWIELHKQRIAKECGYRLISQWDHRGHRKPFGIQALFSVLGLLHGKKIVVYSRPSTPVRSLNASICLSHSSTWANVRSQKSGCQSSRSSSAVRPCCSTHVKYLKLCRALRSKYVSSRTWSVTMPSR